MKYIYIFEDGSLGVSNTGPTATDLLAIGDGRLQVLEVSVNAPDPESTKYAWVEVREFDDDGSYVTPAEAEIHEEEGDDFHIVL